MTAAVKFIRLDCLDDNEVTSDEPYLKLDGDEIWSGGDVDPGDKIDLSHLKPVVFEGTAVIDLWEDDPGIWGIDEDDHLGSYTVYEHQADDGLLHANFTGGDAHYRLTFDVLEFVLV